jgi:hypothetical protein
MRKPHEEVTPPALPPTQLPCRLPRFNRYWPVQYAVIVDQNGKIVCQYEHIDRALA